MSEQAQLIDSVCSIEILSIKDFHFAEQLGKGAFGSVWKAVHVKTNMPYAIKIVLKQRLARMLPQFKREISILSNLNHPHIVKFHGHFEDSDSYYLILEYAENGSLFATLNRQRRFMQMDASQYFRETLSAVQYLHSHSPPIIHRDIKPENILLNSENRVLLADFGWSNYFNDPRKTVCGTIEYLPPEIVKKQEHGPAADIWCLGVLLYEMLMGKSPF